MDQDVQFSPPLLGWIKGRREEFEVARVERIQGIRRRIQRNKEDHVRKRVKRKRKNNRKRKVIYKEGRMESENQEVYGQTTLRQEQEERRK